MIDNQRERPRRSRMLKLLHRAGHPHRDLTVIGQGPYRDASGCRGSHVGHRPLAFPVPAAGHLAVPPVTSHAGPASLHADSPASGVSRSMVLLTGSGPSFIATMA